jgi:hypothetical protein
MDEHAQFIVVAQENHNFFTFTAGFLRLAISSWLDDETLKTLFWNGTIFHNPINLTQRTEF